METPLQENANLVMGHLQNSYLAGQTRLGSTLALTVTHVATLPLSLVLEAARTQ